LRPFYRRGNPIVYLRLSVTTLLNLGVILRNQRCREVTIQRSTRRNHAKGIDKARLERYRNPILRSGTLALREKTTLRTATALKQTRFEGEGNILSLETTDVLEHTLRATAIVLRDVRTNELHNVENLVSSHVLRLPSRTFGALLGGDIASLNLTRLSYHAHDRASTFFFRSLAGVSTASPTLQETVYHASLAPSTFFFAPRLECSAEPFRLHHTRKGWRAGIEPATATLFRGETPSTERRTVYHNPQPLATSFFASLFKGLAGIALGDRRVDFA
jgi:hypothetical protein